MTQWVRVQILPSLYQTDSTLKPKTNGLCPVVEILCAHSIEPDPHPNSRGRELRDGFPHPEHT